MMNEWLVLIQGREYRVEAETRPRAVTKAAHLFRDETGALYTIFLISALARCFKLNRRQRPKKLEV